MERRWCFMFKRVALFLVFALVIGVTAVAVQTADNDKELIVNVITKSKKDVEKISNMGIDIAEVAKGYTTVVVRKREMDMLTKAGFKVEANRNLESTEELKSRFAAARKNGDNSGAYHSYQETNDELKALAKKYPKIAKIEKIGKSFEKRDVYALRISGAGNREVPKVLYMGMHHAREWIATEVPIHIARELLTKYGKDDKITELVNNRVVYIVPIVNPDGLIWSQTQYSYWRKNRNDNGGNRNKGVDPNRNYGYQWGNVGASNYMGSDTYHGTGPFSEPCTQNIKRLAEREKFTASLSYHSYSQLILYPFSYAYNVPNPDEAIFSELAKGMAKFTGYRPQVSADLYPAMGDSDDWLYGTMGCLAFTIELGRRFIPSESLIDPICEKNVKAAIYLLDRVGKVQASTHPSKVSAVKFRVDRINFLAAQAEVFRKKDETFDRLNGVLRELDAEKEGIVAILKPENDKDGKKLDEFLSDVGSLKADQRQYFNSTLTGLKTLYLNEMDKGGSRRDSLSKRIEIIDEFMQ